MPDPLENDWGEKNGFDADTFLFNFRKPLTLLLVGLILIGVGVIMAKTSVFGGGPEVEILERANGSASEGPQGEFRSTAELVVEISGAVETPGVYKLQGGARIDDLLIVAGGVAATADRQWVGKYLNRAAKLTDGQKIYIPQKNENITTKSGGESGNTSAENIAGISQTALLNINTATKVDLESLPGIGPVYAQNIIDKRIYSSVDELLTRGVLKKSVYEKVKDLVTTN